MPLEHDQVLVRSGDKIEHLWFPCSGAIALIMTVVVIAGQRVILVTPERELDLGSVWPDDRIVRELEGTKVVGATVSSAAASGHGSAESEPSARRIALGSGHDRGDPQAWNSWLALEQAKQVTK